MKILVAPNSFKECADSVKIAELITHELEKTGFGDIISSPLSDGGDGFLSVCTNNFDLENRRVKMFDYITERTRYVSIGFNRERNHYFFEVSDAIGLKNIPMPYRKPGELNSKNLGEILYKVENLTQSGAKKKLTIGIGGTGTSDLGLGICEYFGLKLLDKNGNELAVKPKNYIKVQKIILPGKVNIGTEVVLDVEVLLTGNKGTSKVFARQKGAGKKQVELLERGVKNILRVLKKDYQLDFSKRKIGAGGGLALGLSLLTDLKVKLSSEFILSDLGLQKKIKKSDLIITSEGSFDKQSYMNKATGIVLNEAMVRNKRAVIITGRKSELEEKLKKKGIEVYSIESLFNSVESSIRNYRKGIKSIISDITMPEKV